MSGQRFRLHQVDDMLSEVGVELVVVLAVAELVGASGSIGAVCGHGDVMSDGGCGV